MALATASDLDRAQALARSLAGGRYIWGGVSRAGSDCSGFQSILINAVKGRPDPYVRLFATGNWPERAEGLGFRPGLGNGTDYSLGLAYPWELASGIGHVAGTLGGLNVESRGGRGVLVGSAARGADNPLFRHHFHLPIAPEERNDMGTFEGFAADGKTAFKAAVREVLNEGTAQGQSTWAGTSKAVLNTVQGLVNLVRETEGDLAGQVTDGTSAILGALAALPPAELHLDPEEIEALAEAIAEKTGIDPAAILDALHARLAA